MSNGYNYQDIKLLNDSVSCAEIEYIESDNTYGIRFSDLFKQYLLVENTNLQELLKEMGYAEEKIANLPDSIEVTNEIDLLKFSEEEKENLQTKYLSIIGKGFSNESFTKKSNQVIKINGKDISANEYILTMTKEQLNDTYIKLLEELKQDEIILAKLEKLQELVDKYGLSDSSTEENFSEKFVTQIDEKIQEITSNNIGKDETSIAVYESVGVTVRTSIISTEYKIDIDFLTELDAKYVQISFEDLTSEDTNKKTVQLVANSEQKNIYYEENLADDTLKVSFEKNEVMQENDGSKTISIKYEDSTNRVEANLEQTVEIVDVFDDEIILDEENSIILNDLEEEQLQGILSRVTTAVNEKINTLLTDVAKKDDLIKVLTVTGLLKEDRNIEGTGVTETERNRFNSQFELLKAEGLQKDEVKRTIDAVKNNLVGLEVASNTVLKLKMDKNNSDVAVYDTISNYIEKMKDKTFNISIEYDDETGLVSYIVLTIVEEE